jgi:hypothetical protein
VVQAVCLVRLRRNGCNVLTAALDVRPEDPISTEGA